MVLRFKVNQLFLHLSSNPSRRVQRMSSNYQVNSFLFEMILEIISEESIYGFHAVVDLTEQTFFACSSDP